ncbi:MAG: hypothetical protein ACI9V1_001050 [Spirosomataceae bacterium]|jgi:hypothetical protein
MKKLESKQMEMVQGGDIDAACGFAIGFGAVALMASGPLAPATGGLVFSSVMTFCGLSALNHA